jgi:hypothetical protein
MRNSDGILVGKPERKKPVSRLGADGRITLKWILQKYRGKLRTGLIWLMIETSGEPL